MVFGFTAIILIIYRPYVDMLITVLECIFMVMLALICYAASLKTFYQQHKQADLFTAWLAVCDNIINAMAIGILIMMFWVILISL